MGERCEPTLASSAMVTGYRTGVEVRKLGVVEPICKNGKGLGRALGVCLSTDRFLDRVGKFVLSDLFIELSGDAIAAIVEFSELTFITLLGVESTALSPMPGFCPYCIDSLASPMARVGSTEELDTDGSSVRSTSRLCPAGVEDRLTALERLDNWR